MANTIGTAYINIAPNMSGIQGKIAGGLRGSGTAFASQFGNEISGKSAFIIGAIAGVAQSAVTKATSLISNSIGAAVKRVDTLNSAQKTFEYMGFKASDSAKAVKDVTASILGLPTPLDGAIRGMMGLAATYQDVKLGQKVFSALNDAILGFGGSADMVDNAVQQLSQLPLDGPLDAQTWNSLRNSGLTPVLVAIGKDMGLSVSQLKEKLGSGQLTVRDFTNELTKLDTKGGGGLTSLHKIALTATSGIGTGFANMQTAISRGLANIIQAVGQKNISAAITNIGKIFEQAFDKIAKIIPIVIRDIKSFFDFVSKNSQIFAPIAVGIAAIVAALAIWKTALLVWQGVTKAGIAIQAAFNAVMDANPIGLLALAIIGLVAGLTYLFRNTAAGKKIFAELSKIFGAVVSGVKALFGAFTNGRTTVGGFIGVMETLGIALKKVWDFVGKQLGGAFNALGSIFKQTSHALQPLITAIGGFVKGVLANKTVMTILKDIGIALLALAAAPVIAFFGILIGTLTVVSKVLQFVADHFKLFKVIVLAALAPIIAPIALFVAAIKVIPTVISAVAGAISAVFGAIAAAYNATLGPVFSLMKTVITDILTIYVRVWAFIGVIVLGTLFMIAGVIKNVMTAIWGVISSVWSAVWGVISNVLGWIGTRIVTAWNFYYGIISGVLGTIWGVISGVWNRIWGFISGVAGAIANTIAGAWNRAYSAVAGPVSRIWGAITGTFNRIVGYIGSIGGQIARIVGGAGSWLYNAGRSVIQGFLNGMGSLIGSIASFFLNKLPGWIRKPFEHALGIHSPSKVFMDYGENTIAGYVNAVNAGQNKVTGAVSNMADAAIKGISDTNLTAPISATLNTPSANSLAPGTQGGNSTHQEVRIGQVVLGDQGAVKEFFKQLDQDTIAVGMGLTPAQGAR